MIEPLNIELPKWPQMIVTGKQVRIEHAKEIIFRTDSFLTDCSKYAGGNNQEFNDWYRKKSGLSLINEYAVVDEIRSKIGYVETNYVRNDWASCSFVYGPHGWCSPKGHIVYVDNVSKWPDVKEVFEDWASLAQAFPYLDLNVTLMNGEGCEEGTMPLINIRVVDGDASFEEPSLDVHDNELMASVDRSSLAMMMRINSVGDVEFGLPIGWYEEFAAVVRAVIIDLGYIKR